MHCTRNEPNCAVQYDVYLAKRFVAVKMVYHAALLTIGKYTPRHTDRRQSNNSCTNVCVRLGKREHRVKHDVKRKAEHRTFYRISVKHNKQPIADAGSFDGVTHVHIALMHDRKRN